MLDDYIFIVVIFVFSYHATCALNQLIDSSLLHGLALTYAAIDDAKLIRMLEVYNGLYDERTLTEEKRKTKDANHQKANIRSVLRIDTWIRREEQ